ncbi:MAG: hypothetical protein Q9174_007330, partial [Haloplaca sp. 1 TL-2023]
MAEVHCVRYRQASATRKQVEDAHGTDTFSHRGGLGVRNLVSYYNIAEQQQVPGGRLEMIGAYNIGNNAVVDILAQLCTLIDDTMWCGRHPPRWAKSGDPLVHTELIGSWV